MICFIAHSLSLCSIKSLHTFSIAQIFFLMNSGTTKFGSGDGRQSFVVETKNVRRVRRLKYTCRTKIQLGVTGDDEEHGFRSGDFQKDSGTLTKTLSVSFTSSKDDVLLCEEGREVKRYGVASVIGGRKEMEDMVRAEVGFAASGKCDFYGVYDGHGGAQVAKVCRERLHEVVAEAVNNEEDEVDWERVMEGCFGKMDEEVGRIPEARTVGSTAVATVVTDEEIVVANCGDCRAVLARSGGAVALALSSDHKPDRADELERIEAAGGKVINWNGSRVLGVLATSRSIGDQYLRPFVISKPEITVTKRTEDDEFIILASDGLWDVMSNEVACKVVNKVLHGKIKMRKITNNSSLLGRYEYNERPESRITEAASVLAELAMARGSRDNISVIVVDLKN